MGVTCDGEASHAVEQATHRGGAWLNLATGGLLVRDINLSFDQSYIGWLVQVRCRTGYGLFPPELPYPFLNGPLIPCLGLGQMRWTRLRSSSPGQWDVLPGALSN